MGRSLPDFLLWRKGAYRAVDPSERPVDPSERPVARALAAQMARPLTPGARVNPAVNVVSQPDPSPPVPLPPVSDPSKPDAGGAYLTRAEAGQAPGMTGVRPALQHNPADATRADAVTDYLSDLKGAGKLRPESQDFNSGERATDLEDRRAALEKYQPQKRSWFDNVKANILPALLGAGPTSDPLNALGRVIGGVGVGTVDRRSADKLWRNQQEAATGAKLQQEYGQEDAAAKRQVLANQAVKDYAEARAALAKPGLEQGKADAQARGRAQQGLQREIAMRLKEPRAFDATDAYDSDLAQRSAAAGVHFDPQSFGDFKNPAQMEVIDPSDPTGTHKTRLVLDRASGTWQPVQVNGAGVTTGYAQPVGASGMTAKQEADTKLGGERLGETKRRNQVTEGQGQERIGISRQNLQLGVARLEQGEARLSQSADRATRARYGKLDTLIKQRNDARAQANRWRSYKDDDGMVQPWAEKRAGVFEDKIRSLEDSMQSQYGDLLDEAANSDDGMIDGKGRAMENKGLMRTPKTPARGAQTPPAPAQPQGSVSRVKFRKKYPQYKDAPDAQVDSIIGGLGYTPKP